MVRRDMKSSSQSLIAPTSANISTFLLKIQKILTSYSLKSVLHVLPLLSIPSSDRDSTSQFRYPLFNFNLCAWPTMATSIHPVNWSKFFLTNDADICSQHFTDNCFEILSCKTPTSLKEQHISVFFSFSLLEGKVYQSKYIIFY